MVGDSYSIRTRAGLALGALLLLALLLIGSSGSEWAIALLLLVAVGTGVGVGEPWAPALPFVAVAPIALVATVGNLLSGDDPLAEPLFFSLLFAVPTAIFVFGGTLLGAFIRAVLADRGKL